MKKSSSLKLQQQSFYFWYVALLCGALHKSCRLAPRVKNGPTPGVNSSHRLTIGKTYKNLLLQNHMAQSFHILCGAMYSTPLYKSCQRCPLGPYRPRPMHVIIYHRLILEKHEKIFFPATHDTKLVYLICNNVMWSST